MTTTHPELHTSRQYQSLILRAHPTSGTEDDNDDRDDEHAGENEAPMRALAEDTETPEEFEIDERDELGHRDDEDTEEWTAAPES
jgi:hypothetical protein